jgi:hypothetical protein
MGSFYEYANLALASLIIASMVKRMCSLSVLGSFCMVKILAEIFSSPDRASMSRAPDDSDMLP